MVEGPDLVADVLRSGAHVVEVFSTGPPESVPPYEATSTLVDQRALTRLAGTKSPRGPVAVVEIPRQRLDRGLDLLVAAGVSDPGNLGAMARTAAAFGWGFAYTTGSADPWSPKALRSGGGGQFQTPVSLVGLEDLAVWNTVATVLTGGVAASAITGRPVVVLIGEEAHGLDPALVDWADHRLTIAMPGATESLNAAVAAGIVVFALTDTSGQSGAGV